MKHIIFSLLIAFTLVHVAYAQEYRILHDDCDYLKIQIEAARPYISTTLQGGNVYSEIIIDGFSSNGIVGRPQLPVFNANIEVPVCENIVVEIENAVYDTINYIAHRVVPQQRHRSKSDTSFHAFAIDEKAYSTDSFYHAPLATVNRLGVARDRNLATFRFSPVSYNPVSGQLVVCRRADITVRYDKYDRKATELLYSRYHSPLFSIGRTINNLPVKSVRSTSPVRMVIVSAPAFSGQIDSFANWKRQCGFIVDVVYTNNPSVGTTTASIGSYLQGLYTNATATSPAPTYVLLVGDVNLIPAFTTTISTADLYNFGVESFVTDLYYATWSGDDILPEAYYGRFSATTESQLNSIISKTLMYEKCTMPNTSYLNTGILVAGVDGGSYGDYGYEFADPTMDYAAKYYINATNGYSTLYYYKNNTGFSPTGVTVTGSSNSANATSNLHNLYNSGAGWINYSAHGAWNSWSNPRLSVSDVNSMSNNNKPSIMIGNCCLSNSFNESVCLGEALLRKGNNAGAVAYIGATNETFWYEDFYWSVGIRSSITGTMNATYRSNYLGMYDRLFHTHGESLDMYAVTAGAMLLAGNMQVINDGIQSEYYQGTTYTYDFPTYYAETYTLMGDPSLMPWLSEPDDAVVTVGTQNPTSLDVTTNAYAYVALTDDQLNLIASAFADASGAATLDFDSLAEGNYSLAITSQNHKPYFDDLVFTYTDTTHSQTDTSQLDSNIVIIHDTVFVHDTVLRVDTICIHDTIWMYDTVYLNIENPNATQTKLYVTDGTIVIDGATNGSAALYDVSGRRISVTTIRSPRTEIRVPSSGTYFVQINNLPARKITIIR